MEKITKRSGKKKKLTYAQIFHFFEQLRALLGAGITPYAALQIMKKDTDNKDIVAVLDGLSEYVSDGQQLSEAVRASGVFPEYVTDLLILGEHSGKMEDVCGALSRYYEDQDDLRSAIRGAVSYPIVMVGMMFVVVLVLLSRVMPVFAQVFSQLGTSVSGVTKALMDLSDALTKYYVVLIVGPSVPVFLLHGPRPGTVCPPASEVPADPALHRGSGSDPFRRRHADDLGRGPGPLRQPGPCIPSGRK